ncbi:CCA tRNA nucleotidyltransferase [Peptacetobacter sp.]|uniref:CCA tRNA nucleotidyltransferase n=1 Tax=Peptacetobacter sp. TaxID=2991975 RepID=UPI00262225FD|nr:CCA tRNA nucleotidyltransferase [Peptacetobacter sp.]
MIKLPEDVIYIINEIEKNGFEAFAVGGCIRDSILGKTPNDWDITTSAKPKDIIHMFDNTIETGIEHGTVTVIIDKKQYEITTYRIDGEYTDGRHPDNVEFTNCIKDDLSRRDFTINAMAYNNTNGLVDEFEGILDLKRRIIKCVGNPQKRFQEDALRMMRAIRFSAQLDFLIEKETFNAIEDMSDTIDAVSMERINVEFTKTLMSDSRKISLYEESGILRKIIPEIYYNREIDYLKLIRLGIECSNLCQKKLYTRLAAFFVYINEYINVENIKKILKRMKYDNKSIEKTCKLLEFSKKNITDNKEEIKYILMKIGDIELVKSLVDLKRAEVKSYLIEDKKTNKDNVTDILEVFTEESLEVLDRVEKILKEVVDKKECFSLKELEISGKDLIKMGIKPGKDIGKILDKILMEVIKNPDINKKEILIEMVKNIK